MNLLPHQVKFARGYRDKAILAHEGGTGKTICACVWLRDGRDSDALVICPKRVVSKWMQAILDWDTKATVVTKEEFKKMTVRRWSALVVDEADEFASPLFTKGRSQLSASLYALVKEYDMPTLLLTATPVRSNPWNLHSLFCFMRFYIPWKEWRSEFFSLEHRPFLKWAAWFPKKDWRAGMRSLLEKHADIVLMKDCVESLPPITENIMETPSDEFKGSDELNPTARFVEEHIHEQEGKARKILEIGKQYRKVIVVAYYVEQVESLAKELSKDRETFMIHGSVKDQEDIIRKAHESDECFFVVQASLGVGWDGDSFSCAIFTSMSYKVRDFVQIGYRLRRIRDLHPVEYNYLIGGRCDRAVFDIIKEGLDFVPSHWK